MTRLTDEMNENDKNMENNMINEKNENDDDKDNENTENKKNENDFENSNSLKNYKETEIDDNPISQFERKLEEAKKAEQAKNEKKSEKTRKGEQSRETESLQTDISSPVVEKKQGAKVWFNRVLYVVAGILIVVFAAAIFTGSHKSKKVDNANTGASEQMAAPTIQAQSDSNNLPLNNQQIANLKKADFNQQGNNQSQQEAMMEAAKAAEMRMSAPSNVISNGSASNALSANNNKNNAVLGGDGTGDANTAFMAKVSASSAPIAKATRIAHMGTTLLQGSIIQATLNTRISSDLPGMLSATVSNDIYSADLSTLLIPKGSQLIGQYTNNIQQGQNRIFVVWQRLIRPDGIDVPIGSPGTDTLGAAGIAAGTIDHHFFQQFGSAFLLSVIGAGVANVGVNGDDQYNSSAAYRMAIAGSFNQTAKQTLQNTGVIPPTLEVDQGTKISVFVARDLDFYDALNGGNQDNSQATGSLFQGKLS